MKKLYSLLVAAFLLSGGVAFAGYSEPTYQEANKINNTPYNQKETYRAIQLVRYGRRDLPVPVSGDAVIWDVVSADGVTVRLSSVSGDGAFAGIACTTVVTADASSTTYVDDAGRNNWFYIVRTGVANANATAGGTNGNVWGSMLITSKDTGKITTIDSRTAINTTDLNALTSVKGFFMQSADGSSTVYKVYVQTQ